MCTYVCVCVTVEAAGGGGLQLFVDTGVPVDSEIIRHYVNEVLTEIIASMLGQREAQGTPPTASVQTQDAQKVIAFYTLSLSHLTVVMVHLGLILI